jgi:hypothetical protein
MIVIDMDMPKCCGTCNMSGTGACKEWMDLKGYDMGQKRADTCPIKCDIEQIRAEIDRLHYHPKLDFIKNDDVVEMALEVIDKYRG